MIQKLSCYNLQLHLKWCSEKAKLHSKVTCKAGIPEPHISLTTLSKEAHEHLFCKQGSALLLCSCAGGWRTKSSLKMENFKDFFFYFSLMYSESLSHSLFLIEKICFVTHLKRNNTVVTHMENGRKRLTSGAEFYEKSRNKEFFRHQRSK